MTLNIAATSSASPPSVRTELQPKAGPSADAARQAEIISDSATQPGVAPKTAEPPPIKTPAPGSKAEDVKAQNAKALTEAVDELNQRFKGLSRTNLQFNIDDKADQVVVKVMDVETEEVIRQIPPEEMLKLAAFFKEQAEKEAQQMERAAGLAPEAFAMEGLLLHAKV